MATKGNFKDIYQEVTDAVLAQMEIGSLVWRCSWNDAGLPANVTTGICYRGWNVFWLNFHTLLNGYSRAQYLTFRQALNLGGKIRKGEKGIRIVYWATIPSGRSTHVTTVDMDEEADRYHQRLVPKVYTVFNVAQTEGIDFPAPVKIVDKLVDRIDACESLVRQMPDPPVINLHGSCPVYYPSKDEVAVPDLQSFENAEAYYCALFHELAHSTGHARRLNRKEIVESGHFGSESYSREELTAEFTASYLCAVTGIGQQTLENSAAYLQGWLKALRNDKTLLIKAAGQAQRAADYILNTPVKIVNAA